MDFVGRAGLQSERGDSSMQLRFLAIESEFAVRSGGVDVGGLGFLNKGAECFNNGIDDLADRSLS